MENPIRIDDLGVPLFLETSIKSDVDGWTNSPIRTFATMEYNPEVLLYLIYNGYISGHEFDFLNLG